ncbi:MAG TPA: nuclear transport factor 2 family protein [Acidobacteriaceae bacterium]|jgi:ketosteroid isomerase-like protein|nr:nuclear transport factor 2 family protein [Acidobacteriaceae bacterium]
MRFRLFFAFVFVGTLCTASSLRAQQAQSATQGQPQPPEIKQFQALEDQWSTAVVKNDQYTLEYLLSPVMIDIASSGDVTTRNQQIAMLFTRDEDPVSLEQRVVSVRTFGDTAIVSGTYVVKFRTNNGNREERGIFTHVYNRMHDHWACVNAQRTAVVDLTPGTKKAAQQKKSEALEPFHIPFFYKGAQPSQTAAGAPNPPQN